MSRYFPPLTPAHQSIPRCPAGRGRTTAAERRRRISDHKWYRELRSSLLRVSSHSPSVPQDTEESCRPCTTHELLMGLYLPLLLLPAPANTESGRCASTAGAQPARAPAWGDAVRATWLPRGAGRFWGQVRGAQEETSSPITSCSDEVIPTFDFLEAHRLPGPARGWEKKKGKK